MPTLLPESRRCPLAYDVTAVVAQSGLQVTDRLVAIIGVYSVGFEGADHRFIAVLEGKGTRDPLDRPFSGRPMSAVDQAYRYAINLPCDWIIVTSMRETRLYHKGSNQHAFERFETVRLASDPALLKRFVFLLGAERLNWYIVAISLGAVFFGACTYIGNGPNFMVKAIADHQKVATPGFLGFIFRYTLPCMGPMLILIWLLFFRT